ncbi:hypothetical protein [Pseudomonas serboccidentalis]|uniref:hypothetical protein n=1 Tax=Pseudomonas serboccidentalis TaxID=2964670 RepID=UPI0039E06AE2
MSTPKNPTAGTLDPTFGTKGIMTIDYAGDEGGAIYLRSITTTGSGPDEKIYFCGERSDFFEGTRYFSGRLNLDGTPDKAFGSDGVVQGFFPDARHVSVSSLAIQPDGKLVISAHSATLDDIAYFARFDQSGNLDTQFGNNGFTVVKLGQRSSPQNAEATKPDRRPLAERNSGSHMSVEILPDGRILASMEGFIVRLTCQGQLDTSFNQTGYVRVVHPQHPKVRLLLQDLLVQDNNHCVACGSLVTEPVQALLVRYDSAGKPDQSYGSSGNGFILIKGPTDSRGLRLERLARQPNERLLGMGNTQEYPNESGMLTSREPDGKPSIQFNGGEPLYTTLEAAKRTIWMGTAIQKDGKIVVAGALGDRPRDFYELVIARFISGKPDSSFGGEQGWIRTSFSAKVGGYATAMTLQEDGKILAAATIIDDDHPQILRYLP